MTLPLVALHGFSGGPDSWDDVRARVGTSFPIFAPALLGHGADGASASEDFVSEVDRLAALVRARGPRHHLAGYSLGGRMALGLLCRHPDLFVTATLISAQPGLHETSERAARRDADARLALLLEERGIEAFVDVWERVPLFSTQNGLPEVVRLGQRRSRLARDPRGLARSLRATGLAEMPSYWEELAAVRQPTTVLVGELDEKFLAIGRRMAEMLPSARLEIVPGAGHNVVLEAPDSVTAVLRAQVESIQ